MTDTLFEQLGGTYTQTGDYLLRTCHYRRKKMTVPLVYGDSVDCDT